MRRAITGYTVMLYLGAVSGIVLGTRWAADHGLPPARVSTAMSLLLLPALAGARLLFVAMHGSYFRRRPRELFRRSQSGAAMYGGLLLVLPFSVPLLKLLRIDFWRFWDAGAVAMLVGMAFTKCGCFLNGCCGGRRARRIDVCHARRPERIFRMLERVSLRRVPLQLVEAGLAILVLFLSLRSAGGQRSSGVLFLSALAGYGLARWFIEPARETVDRVLGISVNRAISASLPVLAAAAFLFLQH
jgi:phosphatidylglycerol---prolipoprotein diacylglyceryl transferase